MAATLRRADVKTLRRSLDAIGNGALHALEEAEAAEKDAEDGGAGNEESGRGCVAMSGESPAKAVNNTCHGIKTIEPAPALRNERAGVGDGRSEHPELEKERHDVSDVAIKRIERGEPQADAKSGEDGEEQEERKESGGGGGPHAGKQREGGKDDEGHGGIDEAGEHRRRPEERAAGKEMN